MYFNLINYRNKGSRTKIMKITKLDLYKIDRFDI